MLNITFNDFILVLRWWATLLVIGTIFLPLTFTVFKNYIDKGYIFSKIISLVFLSYSIFLLGSIRVLGFSFLSLLLITVIFALINIYLIKKANLKTFTSKNIKLFFIEELVFLAGLIFWANVRGHLPDIHGLEKFMDFGIINSILRSNHFPPQDMWYTQFSINYYYFGHLITAVAIKLSAIPSGIGYNLMLSSLFALTFTSVVSLSLNLFNNIKLSAKALISSFLGASLVTLAGNLTTIYTFFLPYKNENPVPFWTLFFSPLTFPNSYWYPNATRFIPYTIHEFPLYSFVVSDLHGHVLDIPIVLLTIAILFSQFLQQKFDKAYLILISFLLAVMYMTNAWDGLIYLLLSVMILSFLIFNKKGRLNLDKNSIFKFFYKTAMLGVGFVIFSLPFSIHFKPFVSGVGVLCAPSFLTNIGKIGPFLFEAGHCQKSPIWQLAILYGFFYFFVVSFILFLRYKTKYKITPTDRFVSFLIVLSTVLIIVPEFIYVKDIYPMHYRANTMFKLVYEAFIILSISCGYIIVKIFTNLKNKPILISFFFPTIILLYMVLAYPVFAINSFYGNLKSYQQLDGLLYMKEAHPDDYNLIQWLNKNIKGDPVILESVGDSYTDYARISANTGLTTIVGWPVHEWLWRGTYDVVGPRVEEVKTLYTSPDLKVVKSLIDKYHVSYVVVASLDRQKYPNLNEDNFRKLGKMVYNKNGAKLYKIN